jgi:hypothetical protein
MRAIDYFDRGHDLGPDRPCLIDGTSGETLSFAAVKALTTRIAVALHGAGFRNQQPIALYGPNSAAMMVALLAIWRANGQWVPVNTRNAIDANVAYLDYVGCGWLFYHSSQAADVAALKARVPSLTRFVCLDRAYDGDPSLDQFIANSELDSLPDFSDPFGKPDDIVGLFPTGGTTGPSKGVVVTNLGWGGWPGGAGDPVAGRDAGHSARLRRRRRAGHDRAASHHPCLYAADRALQPARRAGTGVQRHIFPQNLPARRIARLAGKAAAGGGDIRSLSLPDLWSGGITDDRHLALAGGCRGGGIGRPARTARQLRSAQPLRPGRHHGR